MMFYLKRERKSKKPDSSIYPVVGKIITGKSIAQFSSKLKVDERLWDVKSGRATGKSHAATKLNREINKITLSIHSHYKEILTRTGKVTALEVKNAFQGIASTQKTLLVLFKEMMREFHSLVGIDRSQSTYREYEKAFKHLQRFIREKYKVQDIPLNQLNLSIIESSGTWLLARRSTGTSQKSRRFKSGRCRRTNLNGFFQRRFNPLASALSATCLCLPHLQAYLILTFSSCKQRYIPRKKRQTLARLPEATQ